MPVQCTCSVCGETFSRQPRKAQAAKYCSPPCMNVGRRTGPMRPCARCGSAFYRPPSDLDKFCSSICERDVPSPVINGDSTASIPLRSRSGVAVAHALIDEVDAAWLSQWCWSLNAGGYARRGYKIDGRHVVVAMHRAILGLVYGDGVEGDHINRNRLDNRRANLRAVPREGNMQNTPRHRDNSSPYRNVGWDKRRCKWIVQVSGRFIGYYTDIEEAAAVAKSARLRLMPYATD